MNGTEEPTDDGAIPTGCNCKVGQTIETYDIPEVNEELVDKWQSDEDSLRNLAERFNCEALRAAMEQSGDRPLTSEVAVIYEVLTSDDVSSGERIQKRRQLEHDGVDVDALKEAFVSHQTIFNHLTGCMGVDKATERPGTSDAEQVEKDSERIYTLQNRIVSITVDRLTWLRETGRIELDEFDVFVDVRVKCNECDRYHTVADLLKHRGCECQKLDA